MSNDPDFSRAMDFIHDAPEDGTVVAVAYDGSYGGDQFVIGEVVDSHLSELTRVKADGLYTVYGSGVASREMGEVTKRSGGSRRKVGEFIEARIYDEVEE